MIAEGRWLSFAESPLARAIAGAIRDLHSPWLINSNVRGPRTAILNLSHLPHVEARPRAGARKCQRANFVASPMLQRLESIQDSTFDSGMTTTTVIHMDAFSKLH